MTEGGCTGVQLSDWRASPKANRTRMAVCETMGPGRKDAAWPKTRPQHCQGRLLQEGAKIFTGTGKGPMREVAIPEF